MQASRDGNLSRGWRSGQAELKIGWREKYGIYRKGNKRR